MAAALALGTAACGSNELRDPGPQTLTEEAGEARGVLILESVGWIKGWSDAPVLTEFVVMEDEESRVDTTFADGLIDVVEVADGEVTVRVQGTYFTPEGMEIDPIFTLAHGQSVSFSTADADAGTNYELKYKK